ncbi:MAG: DUF3696 domain-containing protein [Planctomycetaceae bacterium]|jgi:predicted ATPase|nr:DUF3696 domain-containing protein [Planctomycetaceae bacterium]
MKFTIKNFKCFIDTQIPMNLLTVLTGVNGAGKSSFIQSILLFRQLVDLAKDVPKEYIPDNSVSLNGQYLLALGDGSCILPNNVNDDNISFAFVNDKTNINLCYAQFVVKNNTTPTLALSVISEKSMVNNQECPICRQAFYYLNAERLGPRIRQELKYFSYPHAGWQGEYTAQLLNLESGFYKIDESRKFPNSQNPLLLTSQINDWLDFLIPETSISVTSNPETLEAQIRIENAFTRQIPALATNMGFGISYVLPILATGLIAEAGTMFLVENPEAHLHPSAQTRIGMFLAMVAQAGVHVVVETHSDHVINGIQLAVVKQTIQHELVTVNFFEQIKKSEQPKITPIALSEKGELECWPPGFFDQSQRDLAELFNARRSL